MKITLLTSLASVLLAAGALAQTPPAPPEAATPPAAAAPAITPAAVLTPAPTAAVTPAGGDDLESRIERKVKKGLHITFGNDDDAKSIRDQIREDVRDDVRGHVRPRHHSNSSDFEDSALMAIPIVGIIFSTLFGAPVLIVGLILFFSYWKQRSLHRTVRMMVEKGQPVPEGLFAPPHSPARQRSDTRRGVVLVMVGLGLMIFFGAASDWDGGAWALGIIPFLIGCGYLLIWKMEHTIKASTDNPPPLP